MAEAEYHWSRSPGASVRLSAERVVEGGRVELELTLEAAEACPWLDVDLQLPERLEVADGPVRRVVALDAGETRTLRYSIECPRSGAFRIGPIRLAVRDALHFRRFEATVEPTATLRVYPSVARLRRPRCGPLKLPTGVGCTPAHGLEHQRRVAPWFLTPMLLTLRLCVNALLRIDVFW